MLYWVVKAILWPLLHFVFRPWAEGVENVPKEGPVILAGNHLSFADHFFGAGFLPRKVISLGKAEYFTGSGIKGLFSRAFFSAVGTVPIDRSGGKASEAALRTGLRILNEGKVLGIYPRAPGRPTAASTRARRAWRGWRWSPGRR